nr:uncharacterized protein LOC109185383 isoform X2 [Ipomoea batatas]
MDPIIASLLTSFRLVPPEAIPAMLDCILASTASSPFSIFSALLEEFPSIAKEKLQAGQNLELEQRNFIESYVGALCHILKKPGSDVNSMQLFILEIFIPLMKLVHSYDRVLLNKVAGLLFGVVIETNSWEIVGSTIVPFLLRSIGLSMGMVQNKELAVYKWNVHIDNLGGQNPGLQSTQDASFKLRNAEMNNNTFLSESNYFQLPTSCYMLTLMLELVLGTLQSVGPTSKSNVADRDCAKMFAANLVWDLFNLTIEMLLQSLEHRSSAISFLLPSIFQAFDCHSAFEVSINGQKYVLSRNHILADLWKSCKALFSLGPLERRDAYATLSLSLSFFSIARGSLGPVDASLNGKETVFDLRAQKEFWDEIKKGLVNKESLVRKQSLHTLKRTISLSVENQFQSSVNVLDEINSVPRGLTKRERWAENEAKSLGVGRICNSIVDSSSSTQKWEAFFLLYEMLEEYGTHLVEAAWNHQRKPLTGWLYCGSVAFAMITLKCISSAACGDQKHSISENDQENGVSAAGVTEARFAQESSIDKADLLDVFRFVIESSRQHFNPTYRHQVCEEILDAAVSVMAPHDVPLETLLLFVASLPRELTDSGDLDAWESEAKRWARVLFLVIKGEQDLDPIFMGNHFVQFIQEHGADICKEKILLEWIPAKYLILILSLVYELQLIEDRVVECFTSGRLKMGLDSPGKAVDTLLAKDSRIFEKFTKSFCSLLDSLVSFARLSCYIFDSRSIIEDSVLPGSIKGRLGGPSQRRMPSSTASSVLQAITAIKSVASISKWCIQFRKDASIDFAITFLWNACWKVITSSSYNSEIEAEISLAAYEAVGNALKEMAPMFSLLSLDLVKQNDGLSPSEADDRLILDSFFSTFLQNINSLIGAGTLVRTRRAVLLHWKWICLEALLSIPKFAFQNGVRLGNDNFYFSNDILRWAFNDLVDNLENAGEASVLPILRSVRLLLELFVSGQRGLMVSSCAGISTKMMWRLVHSSWILHVSCNKRRVAPIAALLSSVLQYSMFSDENMHELDGAPGPLKWFVEKILEEGTKSPRTIRLAALHLTGLWLANPSIIKYYIKELMLLTLYGSVAFDEDFEAELSENQEAKCEVAVLAKSPDPELTEEFINTELYARVSVAVLFHRLADIACMAGLTRESNDGIAALASGKMFLLELINSVLTDKDLSKELYKKYSAIHRRKVRAWQMICILSRFVDQDIVQRVTHSLHTCLCKNNLPSVRQYLETFAIHIYLNFPSLVGEQLVPIFRDSEMRPQALSSYVFIAANIILHSTGAAQPERLSELLPPIIPLLTSHHHTLRGFTQLLVYKVLQKLMPTHSSCSTTLPLEIRCFEDLKLYLTDNPDCARLRSSMEGYLDAFDPQKAVMPAGIFSTRVEDLEFECVPATLMDRVITFLNDAREDLRSSMAKDAATIKKESLRMDEDVMCNEISEILSDKQPASLSNDISFDFQRKVTFSKLEMQGLTSNFSSDDKGSWKSLLDMEKEDQILDQVLHLRTVAFEKLKKSRQDIILVASLIDRIPNLAGLTRTCEVFRAGGLAIANKDVLKDKQFQLISVTAEKWVPILEVPVSSMKAFLEKKKQEGFSILGLEQTANSMSLDQYVFPKKTVLVLGREKEGIPVDIIHILDACIEIPQLGVVRSLNVHVSGAIALWEYSRQQRCQ